jgi:hypothetical protein
MSRAVTLQRLLPITLAVWLLSVVALGSWRMFYAWHVGSVMTFFLRSLPLSILSLIVIVIIEILLFRRKV